MRSFNFILLLLTLLSTLSAATKTIEVISIKPVFEAFARGKAAILKTPKDAAIFWSMGGPNGLDMNTHLRDNYITTPSGNGKILLIDQMMKSTGGLAPPGMQAKDYMNDRGYWAAVSKYFAIGASGEVVYLIGRTSDTNFFLKNTVFYQTELPALTRAGSPVTKIIAIDAFNLDNKRVIWTQGDGNWGLGGTDEDKTPEDLAEPPTAGCGLAKRARAGGAAKAQSCPMRTQTNTKANSKNKGGKGATTKGQPAAPSSNKSTKKPTNAKPAQTATKSKAAAPKAKSPSTKTSKVQKGRRRRSVPNRITWDV